MTRIERTKATIARLTAYLDDFARPAYFIDGYYARYVFENTSPEHAEYLTKFRTTEARGDEFYRVFDLIGRNRRVLNDLTGNRVRFV